MWRRPLRVVGIAVVLAFALFPGLVVVQGHPYHLQAQNVDGSGGPEVVGTSQWDAQSFRVPGAFTLTQVELNTSRQHPSAQLTVSIREDDTGEPAVTTLTTATVPGTGSPWLTIPFDPWVSLAANESYWIVASSDKVTGYHWWRSNNSGAYVNGTGMTSVDGMTWVLQDYDFTFRVYGYPSASPNFGVTASTVTPSPGDFVLFNVSLRNDGPGEVVSVWVNVSFPAWLSVSNDTAWMLGGTATCCYAFEFHDLEPGMPAFQVTAQVEAGASDDTSGTSRFDFEGYDHVGNPVGFASYNLTLTVHAPVFSPVLQVDRSEAERGDEVLASFYFNNTGSVSAPWAWQNWTLNDDFEVIALSPNLSYEPTETGISLPYTNLSVGSHSLVARLRVLRGMEDGLFLPLRVTWEAFGPNGVPVSGNESSQVVTLHAPEMEATVNRLSEQVVARTTFALALRIANTGKASATGWLNLTLPPGVTYLGDNWSVTPAVLDGRIAWRLDAFPAETEVGFNVQLQADNPSVISFQLEVVYTDGKGSPNEVYSSNRVLLEVTPSGLTTVDFLLWGGLAGAAAVSFSLLWARHRSRSLDIGEVFVVHRNGLLLSHRSRTLTPDKDQDILVAMLKAVQDFVQDAFSSRGSGHMRSLAFGESTILIEQGTNHYVAVVYQGEDDGSLQSGLRALSYRIEEEYGPTLASWSGDMEEVHGIRDLLPLLWGLSGWRRPDTERSGGPDPVRDRVEALRSRVEQTLRDLRNRMTGGGGPEDQET